MKAQQDGESKGRAAGEAIGERKKAPDLTNLIVPFDTNSGEVNEKVARR